VLDADSEARGGPADASVTRQPGRVLAIMVADCMPVLLTSDDGSVLGAAHAGWRGLAGGVLEATVAAMAVAPGRIHAWLGPAIGPAHFEVGDEVRAAFLAHAPESAAGFAANARGRWQCDLALLARQRLAALGVERVWSADLCTYAQAAQCFSYRRDARTGRMAALLWRTGS
jgi:YfiH family protein